MPNALVICVPKTIAAIPPWPGFLTGTCKHCDTPVWIDPASLDACREHNATPIIYCADCGGLGDATRAGAKRMGLSGAKHGPD